MTIGVGRWTLRPPRPVIEIDQIVPVLGQQLGSFRQSPRQGIANDGADRGKQDRQPESRIAIADHAAKIVLNLAQPIDHRMVEDQHQALGFETERPGDAVGHDGRMVQQDEVDLDLHVRIDPFGGAAVDQRAQIRMHREGVTEQRSLHGQQAGLQPGAGRRPDLHGERRGRAAFEADIGDEQDVQPHGLGMSAVLRLGDAGAAARKLSMSGAVGQDLARPPFAEQQFPALPQIGPPRHVGGMQPLLHQRRQIFEDHAMTTEYREVGIVRHVDHAVVFAWKLLLRLRDDLVQMKRVDAQGRYDYR